MKRPRKMAGSRSVGAVVPAWGLAWGLAALCWAQTPASMPAPIRPPQAAAATAPASAPASMPVTANSQGPMRCEIVAILESRVRFLDESMAQQRPPELKFQIRVAGSDVSKVVRYGNFILEEVIDDAGAALVDASKITDAVRKQTRLSSQPPERLAELGVLSVADARTSTRGAKKLKSVKGSIKVVYAEGLDEVTIMNPLQYVGAAIEDPRLKELGIEILVAKTDAFEPAYEPKSGLALKVKSGEDRIRTIEFFDAWMKNIRARPTPATTKDDIEMQQHRLLGGQLDDKSQMVIKVFKNPREQTIPFEFKDVELP